MLPIEHYLAHNDHLDLSDPENIDLRLDEDQDAARYTGRKLEMSYATLRTWQYLAHHTYSKLCLIGDSIGHKHYSMQCIQVFLTYHHEAEFCASACVIDPCCIPFNTCRFAGEC
jgi:hypothetical protein